MTPRLDLVTLDLKMLILQQKQLIVVELLQSADVLVGAKHKSAKMFHILTVLAEESEIKTEESESFFATLFKSLQTVMSQESVVQIHLLIQLH